MAELVWNAAAGKLLAAYLKHPAHALLLSGPVGIGLGSSAKEVAARLTGKAALVSVIEPEKGVIGIDRIRQLYQQTRSVQAETRCIVIDDADAMGNDAQNALLKLLEEPVANVHFILTSHHETRLLPTIRSRTQHLSLLPITDAASAQLLAPFGLDETKARQALFLASGLPAELARLGSDAQYFADRTARITDARKFLQSDTYTRLTIIKGYTDRQAALDFVAMCSRLLTFTVFKQRNYDSFQSMDALETVGKRIAGNGHVKTHLAYLVTKLR